MDYRNSLFLADIENGKPICLFALSQKQRVCNEKPVHKSKKSTYIFDSHREYIEVMRTTQPKNRHFCLFMIGTFYSSNFYMHSLLGKYRSFLCF